ncbi:MAG: hypothetical protein HND47_13965 [Chloroflexi bacterium]|nr:hypothetical protein [Chloroflexota bacterium]
MYIGIPKESRPFEYRVGLSPAGVEILSQNGHQVFVQHDAGREAGFSDEDYEKAGARLVYNAEEAIARADLLLKVARPTQEELDWLRPGTILAGFLHLASASQDKIDILLEKKITSIAYEQIQAPDGSLSVLRPFSQIGGAMAAQIAARLLQNNWGGKGILMGGVPGVPPAEVVILGAGVIGTYATQMCSGMGAHVTVVDRNLAALQRLWGPLPVRGDEDLDQTEYRAFGDIRGCADWRSIGAGATRADFGHARNGALDETALRHHGRQH